MKKTTLIGIMLLLVIGLTGCEYSTRDKIKINGSTSMEELTSLLVEAVPEKYPELFIEAQFTGSSAGIESLIKGTSDIANSSRGLTEKEKAQGLVENVVAIDGISIITGKDNKVNNLTKQQIRDIFQRKITNWQEVGGADEAIVLLGRESGSGTRGAFEEILGLENKCKYSQEIDSTGAVIAKVAATPGAIGYASLADLTSKVKSLAIDGVSCTRKNIANGKYGVSRPFIMVTKGKMEKQGQGIKKIFKYLESDEGEAIIRKAGLVKPR